MAILLRYTTIKNGGIVFTGNTLGLSKQANANSAGLVGSIGAFISLNTSLQVGNFPPGTTLDYTKNGSSALLDLPVGSNVLYAELVWGGLYRSSVNNISNIIDNPIEFRTPAGSFSVSPDAATKQIFNIPSGTITIGFYVRTANVTSLVQSGMSGTYSAGKVPALLEAIDSRTSETNHAGWTLAVVYENAGLPLRNLTLWSGGALVSPAAGNTDVTLSGFVTPDTLPITGKLFVSAQEGDAIISGDKLQFGQSLSNLQTLSGPNNPAGNFFASQINNSSGMIDTAGTFGTRNASAMTGTNISAGRQGWDITAVDVSSLIVPGQTAAVIRFTSDGDLYVANCVGLQIDSKGAILKIEKKVDKTYAMLDEVITYSFLITNSGTTRAETVTLQDILPSGLTLVDGSIRIDGVPYTGTLPVTFGPLNVQTTAVVTFSVKAETLPAINPVFNIARVGYTFMPLHGVTVHGSAESNFVSVFIVEIHAKLNKSVDKVYAVQGEYLTYTSVLKNDGNLPLMHLFFQDVVPQGTSFVGGSVSIDGIFYAAYDPTVGFPLPSLAPGSSITIKFQVQIISSGE